jgi:TPR repeat protein
MYSFYSLNKLIDQYRCQFASQGPAESASKDGGDPDEGHGLSRISFWVAIVLVVGILAFVFVPRHVSEQSDLAQLQHQAEFGARRAQLELAVAYRDGLLGLRPDPRMAAMWLTKAAEGGNADAAALLGDAYSQGDGVPLDLAKAEYWWQQAAKAGNAHAEAQLGKALEQHGSTLEKKYEGELLLGQAAKQEEPGNPEPSIATAETITTGGQSLANLLSRAKAGDSVAEYQLAMRYLNGALDVRADPKQALSWLRAAADHGNPIAMDTLADAYEKGKIGLTANHDQAQLWRQRAAAARQALSEVKQAE